MCCKMGQHFYNILIVGFGRQDERNCCRQIGVPFILLVAGTLQVGQGKRYLLNYSAHALQELAVQGWITDK